MSSKYTVRIDTPADDSKLRKFALAVSAMFTKLAKKIETSTEVKSGEAITKSGSWAISLYDEVTGVIAFLPGVRFVPVGADDVNIGFELDVSPRVGSGEIGGTAQGYMANFGTPSDSKLAGGMSANNEDTNVPRIDIGFKPKRGATIECYADEGDSSNDRKGQLRATLGPSGELIVVKYVSGDRWEVLGGFGPNGELLCGYKNTGWPQTGDTWGTVPAPPGVLNVYPQTGGIGSETEYTKTPVAAIDDIGAIIARKVTLYDGSNTDESDKVVLDPSGVSGELTFTLQQKTFAGDANPSWVLCAAT